VWLPKIPSGRKKPQNFGSGHYGFRNPGQEKESSKGNLEGVSDTDQRRSKDTSCRFTCSQ
jgi:hypothetical protein